METYLHVEAVILNEKALIFRIFLLKFIFAGYALNWLETYSKPNVETAAATKDKTRMVLNQSLGAVKRAYS